MKNGSRECIQHSHVYWHFHNGHSEHQLDITIKFISKNSSRWCITLGCLLVLPYMVTLNTNQTSPSNSDWKMALYDIQSLKKLSTCLLLSERSVYNSANSEDFLMMLVRHRKKTFLALRWIKGSRNVIKNWQRYKQNKMVYHLDSFLTILFTSLHYL